MRQDSTGWVPMEAIARSYGLEQQYEQAVSWMEKALETIDTPFTDMNIDSFLLAHLSGWKKDLGDHSTATEIANKCVSSTTHLLISFLTYLICTELG